MHSFSNYVNDLESDVNMNSHIDHLEDLMIEDGDEGRRFALNTLGRLRECLYRGKVDPDLNISLKWDGSPALVFGPDTLDGRFFVATKAAFNKVPKLCKSHEDVNAYPEALRPILHAALGLLPLLQPSRVLQGDFLFLNDPEDRLPASSRVAGSLETRLLNGTRWLTFKPNTLIYGVEEDTPTGQRVATAGMGIALHTAYEFSPTAVRAENLSAGEFSALGTSPQIFVIDANYDNVSGAVTFSGSALADLDLALAAAREVVVAPTDFDAVGTEPLRTEIRRFVNHLVRTGQTLVGSEYVAHFVSFLDARKEQAVSKLKTLKGRNNTYQRYVDMEIDARRLEPWFTLHSYVQRAKDIVVQCLSHPDMAEFDTFVDNGDTLQRVGPEGFVVSTRGRTVKLVDRQEFSRRNFNASRNR